MKTPEELIKSLKEERNDLEERMNKAELILLSDEAKELDDESRELLWEQVVRMSSYSLVLWKRIAHEETKIKQRGV